MVSDSVLVCDAVVAVLNDACPSWCGDPEVYEVCAVT